MCFDILQLLYFHKRLFMALLKDIILWCDQTLKSPEFKDYAPNGLQIEGKSEVKKILCAVTASQDAIDAAIEKKRTCYWSIMDISGKVNLTQLQGCEENASKVSFKMIFLLSAIICP